MSTDTQDAPLAVKFANSNIPDDVLLRLLDSVTVASQHREALHSGRHSAAAQFKLLDSLCKACDLRDIDIEAGVKVVTTTVNLLV